MVIPMSKNKRIKVKVKQSEKAVCDSLVSSTDVQGIQMNIGKTKYDVTSTKLNSDDSGEGLINIQKNEPHQKIINKIDLEAEINPMSNRRLSAVGNAKR